MSLKLKNKVKAILSLLGIKFIIYKILLHLIKWIINTNIFFIRGVVFDVLNYKSKFVFVETKKKDKFIIFTNDKVISKEIYVSGEFDIIKLERSLNFLNQKKKINNLYDIGANIGVTCISALNRGLVNFAYAVEPEPANFKLLKINIELNNLQNKIKFYNCALSNKDDEILDMEISENNSGDNRIKKNVLFNYHGEEKRQLVQVKTRRFDTLFENANTNDLVWMDTQGYEPVIMQGANNLIPKKIPIVVEFWPYALKRSGELDNMINIISQFDYVIDLSDKEIFKKKIDKKILNELKNSKLDKKGSNLNFFTDLLLLKN